MQVGPRDLYVVTEDLVVSDAQALDARTRTLALLHLGQIRLTVTQERPQLIQFRREAFAYDARIPAAWNFICDGAANERGGRFAERQGREHRAETIRLSLQDGAHARNRLDALGQRQHFLRSRCTRTRTRRETLKVVNKIQRGAKLRPVLRVRDEPCDMLLPPDNLGSIKERLTQVSSEQSSAHRRARPVQDTEQRQSAGAAIEDFQTTHGLRVQHHKTFGVITGETHQLPGGFRLRIAQVSDQGSGGACGQSPAYQSEGYERACLEMV